MKRDLRLIEMGVLLIMAMALVIHVAAMPPESFKKLFISTICDQESDSPNCASEVEDCMKLLQFNPGKENGPPPDPSIICADRPLFECIEEISNCSTLISAGVGKLSGVLGLPGGPSGPGGFGFPGGPSGPGGFGFPGGPSGSGGSGHGGFGATEELSGPDGSGHGGFGATEEPSGPDGSGHGGFGATEEPSGPDGSGHGGFGDTEEPSGPDGSGHGGFGDTEEPSGPDGSGHGGFGATEKPSGAGGSGHGGFGSAGEPSGSSSSGHGGFGSSGGPSDSGGSEGSVFPGNSFLTKEMIQGLCATRDTPNCVEQVQQCFKLIETGGNIPSGVTKESQECVGENCARCSKMIEPTPKFLSAAQVCALKVSGNAATLSLKECMKPTMEDHVRSVFTSDIRPKLLKSFERCYQDFDFEGIHPCMIKSCNNVM